MANALILLVGVVLGVALLRSLTAAAAAEGEAETDLADAPRSPRGSDDAERS